MTGVPKRKIGTNNKKPPEKSDVKIRTCLMHGGPFESRWMGERVCKECRSSQSWKSGLG